MKKTVLVVALATALVLVFAGSAFAEFNRSGQQFLGAAPAPSAIRHAGLDTNIYMDWATASACWRPTASTTRRTATTRRRP